MIELKFVNTEVDEPEVIRCDKASVEAIMRWYGAFYAGDEYKVFADGKPMQKDMNGELEPVVIDVRPVLRKLA